MGRAGRRDQEERDFQDFARSQDPTVEERILSHMAPGIFGHENIKRAVACLLFGGTRKVHHPPSLRTLWRRTRVSTRVEHGCDCTARIAQPGESACAEMVVFMHSLYQLPCTTCAFSTGTQAAAAGAYGFACRV